MYYKFKKFLGILAYEVLGTPNFIRIIEWRYLLEWLDPKKMKKFWMLLVEMVF